MPLPTAHDANVAKPGGTSNTPNHHAHTTQVTTADAHVKYATTQHTVGYVEKDNVTTTPGQPTTSYQQTQVHHYWPHTAPATHDAATASEYHKTQKVRNTERKKSEI